MIKYVEWIDACTQDGWADNSEGEDPLPILKSIGYCIHEDEEKVVLSTTVSTDHAHIGHIQIPKVSVKKVKEILL